MSSISRIEGLIAQHYDQEAEFYDYLGTTHRSYSCNVWKPATTTNDEAALNKYRQYNQILNVQPTDNVLEIGSGWGGMAKFFKNKVNSYRAINITKQQVDWTDANIPGVTFIHKAWQEYEPNRRFDFILGDGVLVHAKYAQKRMFRRALRKWLKPNGKVLLKEMHFDPNSRVQKQICAGLNHTFKWGEYRTLQEDVDDLTDVGFTVNTTTIPIINYIKTMREWKKQMRINRVRMKQIHTNKYRLDMATWNLYLELMRRGDFTVDIMVCNV